MEIKKIWERYYSFFTVMNIEPWVEGKEGLHRIVWYDKGDWTYEVREEEKPHQEEHRLRDGIWASSFMENLGNNVLAKLIELTI